MTQEEKAKAYDRALEKARDNYKAALEYCDGAKIGIECFKNTLTNIFPMLKEPKTEDEKIKKALIDYFNHHKNGINIFYGIKGDDILAWLEKQGEQKPADKVEPKFKVDDWVVYYRNDSSREVLQVYDIRDGRYYFTDNVHFSWSVKECDEKSHLWTIQDAKDGDVLATDDRPFIYNGNINPLSVGGYCGITYDGHFKNYEKPIGYSTDGWTMYDNDIHPATKEQSDLLFSKMKEAGYEWDAEKKELKKFHIIDEGKAEMDYCFTKMMNGEKVSSAWSEEDEKMLVDAYVMLDWYKGNNWWTARRIKDWLNSLKERIGG